MGAKNSTVRSATLPPPPPPPPPQTANASPAIALPKPTVAVIGGGLAGLHVAFELNRCGFDVTVLEARSAVGGGSLQCAANCVNAPFVPTVFDAKIPRMFLVGLFGSASTGLLSRETCIGDLLTRRMACWAKARLLHKGDRDRVLSAGTWLGQQSAAVYRSLGTAFPEDLEPALFTSSEGPSECVNGQWSATAPPGDYLYIEPQRWVDGLQGIIKREGVRLLTHHRVERVYFNLLDNEEFVTSLAVSDTTAAKPQLTMQRYDAYVLCAGAGGAAAVGIQQALPIIGVKGYALRLQLDPRFTRVLECDPLRAQRQYTAVLSRKGYVYENKAGGDLVIAGLAALDSREHAEARVSVQSVARKLAAHAEVTITEEQHQQGALAASPIQSSDIPDNSTRGAVATDFVRSVTPDGLPFISPLGATKNAFILAGFGDSELRWAPAAAVVLRKLVIGEEVDTKETNPFSMRRFGLVDEKLADPAADTERAALQDCSTSLLIRTENALASPMTTLVAPLAQIEESLRAIASPTQLTSVFGAAK